MPARAMAHMCRVYPRVCGGATKAALKSIVARGLSPRVRGSPVGVETASPVEGSIPACAGEPLRNLTRPWLRWVYPRVCGGARLLLSF